MQLQKTYAMTESLTATHFRAHQQVVEAALGELSGRVEEVARVMVSALRSGGKVLAFGNGGSATQASHLVGELVGRFSNDRAPLPAIALASDPGTVTCIANDFGFANLFERQVQALAQSGDIAIGFTASGRSENVVRGLAAAKARGATTIVLMGAAGLVNGSADYLLAVPSASTAHVQELHLMILHALCIHIEREFTK